MASTRSRFSLDSNSGIAAGNRFPWGAVWIALASVVLASPLALSAQTATAASPSTASSKSLYTLVELPGLAAGNLTVARAVNASGQLVGRSGSVNGSDTRAVLWTSGLAENLGTLPGGDYSAAFGINRRGDVVGTSNTATTVRAFVWSRGSGIRDLGALPGDVGSEAFDINTVGEIVGSSSGPRGIHAVLWDRAGRIEDLGVLPGGDYAKAVKINDAGQVIGVSNGASGTHAFFWTREDGMRDLGTLPGFTRSEAVDINRSGQVVGHATGPPECAPSCGPPKRGCGISAPSRAARTARRSASTIPGGSSGRRWARPGSRPSSGRRRAVWRTSTASVPPVDVGLVLSEGQGIGSSVRSSF